MTVPSHPAAMATTVPVSVVVPTYEDYRFLRRCLPAVWAQTAPPTEVIVVNDGWHEDAGPLLAELGLPVRLLRHESNRGLPAARNTGIRAAASDLLALHDCDDWWRPEKLACQAALLDADPSLDFVFCDFVHRTPDGQLEKWRGGLLEQLRGWGAAPEPVGTAGYRLPPGLHELLIAKGSFIHPSTVLVRRCLLDRAGLFDESLRHMEDLEMWIRLAEVGQFGFVDAVLVDVEQRSDSLGHERHRVRAAEYTVTLYERLAERYPNLPPAVRAAVTARLATTHADLGWEYGQRGEMVRAREHFRKAARLEPSAARRLAVWKNYVPRRLASAARWLRNAMGR